MTHSSGNSSHMKQNNQKSILNALFYENLSRADLSRRLGLTRSSLSVHAEELINSGLIIELDDGQQGENRKCVRLDINPNYRFAGGFFFSGNNCYLGLSNLKGHIIKNVGIPINRNDSPDSILGEASALWKNILEETGIDKKKVLEMGVSVPGPVNTLTGETLNPHLHDKWQGFPLEERFTEQLGVPAIIEDKTSGMVLAELRFGICKEYQNFIYIQVDNEIGGGLVKKGRLLTGEQFFGGAIGHVSIHYDGRRCACGNIGCLECYAAIPVLLRDMFSPGEGYTSWRQVIDNAHDGDRRCLNVIEKEVDYLACALISLVNLFEPEAIAFGGDLLYKPEIITGMLKGRLEQNALTRGIRKIPILPSQLASMPAGEFEVLTAATNVINKFLA